MFLGEEWVGVALGLADLLDGLRGELAELGHFFGGGLQGARVGQPRTDLLREEFFSDFAGLFGHVFAGTIQLATQAGNFGFFRRQLGIQGHDVCVERGGLLGRFLRLACGILAGLANLSVLCFKFIGMLAADLAAFVFTRGFTLGEFLQQSSHGLAGGVEGLDGVERFFFRRTPELGHGRLPCFGFRLVGLRFGVGQQAGEEVRGQGGVLLFGLIIPEHAEKRGARAADGAGEFVQVFD